MIAKSCSCPSMAGSPLTMPADYHSFGSRPGDEPGDGGAPGDRLAQGRRPQASPVSDDHRSAPAVGRLQRAMAEAVAEHSYFHVRYPREIADRTARIVRFAVILDSIVNLHRLDFVDTIILLPLEEQIAFIQSAARRGWGGWQ
jgi:hypothetical protein